MYWPFKLFISTILIAIISSFAGFILIWSGAYLVISPHLPDTKSLSTVRMQTPLHIYSMDGKLIGRYGSQHHKTILYDDTPELLIKAILAAEDDRFFSHHGVDLKSMGRAIYSYISGTGDVSGGSTITMQLAKMYFLSYDQTILRKLNQIFLALHIEKNYSKEKVLELYFNKIYLGNHAYGVETAAETYYNKPLDELSLAQTAMIAGLPKAPSANNPLSNPAAALARRNWILKRMYQLDYIDYYAYLDAIDDPNTAQRYKSSQAEINNFDLYAYPAEMARQQAYKMFGDDIYTGGYSIYTTIDSKLQQASKYAVVQGLNAYAQRHGYRGAEKHIDDAARWQSTLKQMGIINDLHPAIVTDIESRAITAMLTDGTRVTVPWSNGLEQARPFIDENHLGPSPKLARHICRVGDLIRLRHSPQGWYLSQIPKAQAALVALAPQDGKILAMSGGYDYNWSKFNRAAQAERQPGSSLKPLLYAAAMELTGLTAASVIEDAPIEFETDKGVWKPGNAGGKFYGLTRLRQALYYSRNVVSIRLLEKIGLRNFINYLGRFGIDTKRLPFNLSLALGTNSMTPLGVANTYADIANGGYHVTPYLITHIQRYDETIYQANAPLSCFNCNNHFVTPQNNAQKQLATAPHQDGLLQEIAKPSAQQAPRSMDEQVNYILDSMLEDVIKKGTGIRAQVLNRSDIRGKTGTTNGPLDAWFSGYHPDIAVTTWLGFDQNEPLGTQEYGGSAALPIWVSFMRQALKELPEKFLAKPKDITLAPIDPKTGKILAHETPYSIMELFRNVDLAAPDAKKPFAEGEEETASGTDNPLNEGDANFDPSLQAQQKVLIYDTQLGTYVNSDAPANNNDDATEETKPAPEAGQKSTPNEKDDSYQPDNSRDLKKEDGMDNDIDALIKEEATALPANASPQ